MRARVQVCTEQALQHVCLIDMPPGNSTLQPCCCANATQLPNVSVHEGSSVLTDDPQGPETASYSAILCNALAAFLGG